MQALSTDTPSPGFNKVPEVTLSYGGLGLGTMWTSALFLVVIVLPVAALQG